MSRVLISITHKYKSEEQVVLILSSTEPLESIYQICNVHDILYPFEIKQTETENNSCFFDTFVQTFPISTLNTATCNNDEKCILACIGNITVWQKLKEDSAQCIVRFKE